MLDSLCVCYRPPVHTVCLNHELVVFQPWKVSSLYLGSVSDITTILALPPHLFWPCSISSFNPPPGPISYRSPIFHLSTPLLSLFSPTSTPSHITQAWRDRTPGRRPHPPASTDRLRFPPMPFAPTSFLREPVTAFPHPVALPLSFLTCAQVPVVPRGFPFPGPLTPSTWLHNTHTHSPPCQPRGFIVLFSL